MGLVKHAELRENEAVRSSWVPPDGLVQHVEDDVVLEVVLVISSSRPPCLRSP